MGSTDVDVLSAPEIIPARRMNLVGRGGLPRGQKRRAGLLTPLQRGLVLAVRSVLRSPVLAESALFSFRDSYDSK